MASICDARLSANIELLFSAEVLLLSHKPQYCLASCSARAYSGKKVRLPGPAVIKSSYSSKIRFDPQVYHPQPCM